MYLNQPYTDCPFSDFSSPYITLVGGLTIDQVDEVLGRPNKPLILSLAESGCVTMEYIDVGQTYSWLRENYCEGAD